MLFSALLKKLTYGKTVVNILKKITFFVFFINISCIDKYRADNSNNYCIVVVHFNSTATLGCLSPRIVLEMTHNRTANSCGTVAHNVALDMKCEHCNRDFQGIVTFHHMCITLELYSTATLH